MGHMNNQLASINAAQQSTSAQLKLEKLIGALKDCGELGYFNHVSSNFKFQIAGRWSTLETRVRDDINSTDSQKTMCSVDALEKVLDLVITRANHTYDVTELSVSEAATIRTAILQISNAAISSTEASLYPAKMVIQDGTSYVPEVKLCKVVDLGDGLAMIFSSVTVHRVLSVHDKYSQAFHTVFVPNDRDRIEFRVSNSVRATILKSEFHNLKQAFINEVNLRGNIVSFNSTNVFKAISSIYNDANEGRVNYAKMSTFEDIGDVICNGKSDPVYCSRSEFTLTVNAYGNDYHPRLIKVKYKYDPNSSEEMEVIIAPHRSDWESKKCELFSIIEPKDSLSLSTAIDNILSRS
jgi:hypothetical protein